MRSLTVKPFLHTLYPYTLLASFLLPNLIYFLSSLLHFLINHATVFFSLDSHVHSYHQIEREMETVVTHSAYVTLAFLRDLLSSPFSPLTIYILVSSVLFVGVFAVTLASSQKSSDCLFFLIIFSFFAFIVITSLLSAHNRAVTLATLALLNTLHLPFSLHSHNTTFIHCERVKMSVKIPNHSNEAVGPFMSLVCYWWVHAHPPKHSLCDSQKIADNCNINHSSNSQAAIRIITSMLYTT